MSKLFRVIVELYELLLTGRKDDRFGRAVSTGRLKVDDLIGIAVTRRSDINPTTMKAAYDILKEVALEEALSGKHVEFGLSHYSLGVNGVFIGDHAGWDTSAHSLCLNATPTAEARQALKEVTVEVRGMAASGTYVNTLTDAVSGEVNSRITPGGGVKLAGVKLKIAGDAESTGVRLTEINSGEVTVIPATSVLVNEPTQIMFIAPANLPTGDYRLSIVSQYAGTTLLKEPRTYVFDYDLISDNG